jgi:hypothetical protein
MLRLLLSSPHSSGPLRSSRAFTIMHRSWTSLFVAILISSDWAGRADKAGAGGPQLRRRVVTRGVPPNPTAIAPTKCRLQHACSVGFDESVSSLAASSRLRLAAIAQRGPPPLSSPLSHPGGGNLVESTSSDSQ